MRINEMLAPLAGAQASCRAAVLFALQGEGWVTERGDGRLSVKAWHCCATEANRQFLYATEDIFLVKAPMRYLLSKRRPPGVAWRHRIFVGFGKGARSRRCRKNLHSASHAVARAPTLHAFRVHASFDTTDTLSPVVAALDYAATGAQECKFIW